MTTTLQTPPATDTETIIGDDNPPEFAPGHITVIQPTSAWQIVNLREIYAYRDLYRFLTWRTIKVRYAQSAVGIGWAILQPAFQIAMFTLVFGRLAQIDSDGVPYAAFSLATIVAWTYFSNALTAATDSLVGNASMISKVYFPRLILPLSAATAALFDFAIAFVFAITVLIVFGFVPTGGIVMLPVLITLMAVTAFGLGLWATALAIQYRDVKHAMTFLVQLAMYASPVIYPTSKLPETYTIFGSITIWPQYIYAINPMVGVLEGFRSALIGTRAMPYGWIAIGILSATLITLSGMIYFRGREKVFADVA